eukprot:7569332-Ditylum_brightwellii.AAC.1
MKNFTPFVATVGDDHRCQNNQLCTSTNLSEEKDKYLPMCREQRKNFTPFVATVKGFKGRRRR